MTEDQRKKYEEAANVALKEYQLILNDRGTDIYEETANAFLDGYMKASKDTEERLKQAHNEAIEKAIDLLGRRVGFGYLEENWDSVKAEIQKLKL